MVLVTSCSRYSPAIVAQDRVNHFVLLLCCLETTSISQLQSRLYLHRDKNVLVKRYGATAFVRNKVWILN